MRGVGEYRLRGRMTLGLMAALGATTAQAQDRGPIRGYSLLFGVHPAYVLSNASKTQVEDNRTGFFLGANTTVSASSESLILDAGFGWFYSELKGEDPPVEVVGSTGSPQTEVTRKIGTQALYAELSPRLRFDDLHVGPQMMILFGEDTTFSPEVGSTSVNAMIGGQIGYIYRAADFDLRFAVRYDTSITIANRQVHMIGFSVAYGLPMWTQQTKTIVKERRIVQVKERKVLQKVSVFRYALTSDLVNFEYDKDKIVPESLEFVRKLGDFLVQRSDLWTKIVIEGHTDSRGTDEYNMELSRRRSNAVARALAARGVDPSRLDVRAYGESRPIDVAESDLAMARNRRVELHFFGVADRAAMNEGLEQVRLMSSKPTTCDGPGDCR